MRDSIIELFEYIYKPNEAIDTEFFINKIIKQLLKDSVFFLNKDKICIRDESQCENFFSLSIEKLYSQDKKEIFFKIRIITDEDKFNYTKVYSCNFFTKLRNIFFKKFRYTFTNFELFIIKDRIAQDMLIDAYPIILNIENSMRELIVKLLNFKGTSNWFDEEIPFKIKENLHSDRKEFGIFALDFSHLSSVLFEKNRKAENIDKILSKLENLTDCENSKIEKIKQLIPQSNWEKYFNNLDLVDTSKILNYEELKSLLNSLKDKRNSVAHNNLFINSDFIIRLKEESDKILGWIYNAIDSIEKESLKFSQRTIFENLPNDTKEIINRINLIENILIEKFKSNGLNINSSEIIQELSYLNDERFLKDIQYYLFLKKSILEERKIPSDEDLEKYNLDIDELILKVNNLVLESNFNQTEENIVEEI